VSSNTQFGVLLIFVDTCKYHFVRRLCGKVARNMAVIQLRTHLPARITSPSNNRQFSPHEDWCSTFLRKVCVSPLSYRELKLS